MIFLRRILPFSLITFLLFSRLAFAESFTVESAKLSLKDDVYYLSASLTFPLSKSALKAIKNSVPLYIALTIKIYDNNNWWLDSKVATIEQTFKIEYFELAKLYQVTNINTGEQNNFLFLSTALDSIAKIKALPLIDKVLLSPDENYYASVQTDLLISKLPLPLIPLALVASEWEHASLKHLLVLK